MRTKIPSQDVIVRTTSLPGVFFCFPRSVWVLFRWSTARWSNFPFSFLGPTIRLHRNSICAGNVCHQTVNAGVSQERGSRNRAAKGREPPESPRHTDTARGYTPQPETCDPIEARFKSVDTIAHTAVDVLHCQNFSRNQVDNFCLHVYSKEVSTQSQTDSNGREGVVTPVKRI